MWFPDLACGAPARRQDGYDTFGIAALNPDQTLSLKAGDEGGAARGAGHIRDDKVRRAGLAHLRSVRDKLEHSLLVEGKFLGVVPRHTGVL
ncbi:MAG TPA: hypothetical protein VNR51_03800 [Hyphomicrobium sp.]|nr:hypothetical protein [Hyphomicrobium sp.]